MCVCVCVCIDIDIRISCRSQETAPSKSGYMCDVVCSPHAPRRCGSGTSTRITLTASLYKSK